MTDVRLLLVDDSELFTDAMVSMLGTVSDVTVVGIARNGVEAVDLTTSLSPDVVLMDVHMPVMGGLDAVERIMASKPTPILVFTSATADEIAPLSMEALARGALDVMAKPESLPEGTREIEALASRLRMLASVSVIRHPRANLSAAKAPPPLPRELEHAPTVIGIVASTGGPSALARVLVDLPSELDATIVIAQHLDDAFGASLASWLDRECPLHVRLASDGATLEPSTVFIAPPGMQTTLRSTRRLMVGKEPDMLYQPSGDRLLGSLAAKLGRKACGVVLTGMGTDGAEGLEAISIAGGTALVQDGASSVVDGMPRACRTRGFPCKVLPLSSMSQALVEVVRRHGRGRS